MNDFAELGLDLSTHAERIRAARGALQQALDGELEALPERFRRPEISTAVGQHQRHQTRVPTRSAPDGTVLSMGRRQDGRNHDGFGLTTIAHVDMRAEGGKAESAMTLQANGQVVLQSDLDSVYVLAAGPAVLASSAVSNVLGGAGVVLASGSAVPIAPVLVEGEAPAAPGAMSGHADAMQARVDAWGEIEGALDQAVSDRDELQSQMAPSQSTELGSIKGEVKLGELADGTFKGPNVPGEAVDGSEGAMALSAGGGLLIDTPKDAAVHAGRWMSLSAPSLAAVGHETVDLVGGQLVALTSGKDARLYAKERVDVVAHTGVLHLASRSGAAAEVQATAIHIGATEPESPQEATASVHARSTTHIGLATGSEEPSASDAGIHLVSHDVIEGRAATSVTLEAADLLTFKIGDAEISVVIDKQKTITITTQSASIELSHSGGLSVKHNAEVIKGSKNTCFIGPSGSNRLEATTSGVSIKGGNIKIG